MGTQQQDCRQRRIEEPKPQLLTAICSRDVHMLDRYNLGRMARTAAALVATAVLISPSNATVTSQSTFERCLNDEPCEEKLTIVLNIQSGANDAEEILIQQVDCEDGLCEGAGASALNNTLKLSLYHTRPVLGYDLVYMNDYNAHPKEVVVYGSNTPGGDDDCSESCTDGCTCSGPEGLTSPDPQQEDLGECADLNACFGTILGPTCEDGSLAEHVACGWLYPSSYMVDLQRAGHISTIDELLSVDWLSAPLDRSKDRVANVVPDSQGFCCDCDLDEFLFESTDVSRGNLVCDALGHGPHASAHCMRMGNLWYSTYEIGQSRENYNIYLNVQACDSEGNNCERPPGMRITSVGPERPRSVVQNDGNDIRIEWVPYGTTDNARDLSNKLLMRPNCHGNQECVAEYAELTTMDGALSAVELNDPTRWLLIDREHVTFTGNECNKIGLGYAGFRNQGENKCIRPYEACLDDVSINGRLQSSSRIDDYLKSDLEAAVAGQVGQYFPQFIYPGSQLGLDRGGDDFAKLEYEVDEYRVSQVTLILSGQLLAVREFTGILEIVDFGLSCMNDAAVPSPCFTSSFEAASNDGLLSVTLRNIGENPDMYTVSFPSEYYEIDNGDGTYTNMASTDNADLSVIQAKTTDTLPGREGKTKQCAPGRMFNADVSARATQCWEECVPPVVTVGGSPDGRRRLQDEDAGGDGEGAEEGAGEDSGDGEAGETGDATGSETSADVMACLQDPDCCDPYRQCGGGSTVADAPFMYEDLVDDCDTLAFQLFSNNGIQAAYCVRMEVRNSIGQLVFPNSLENARVCFNTTETIYNRVGEAEGRFAAGGEPLLVEPLGFECSQYCPSTTDIACLAGQPSCQDILFQYIGAVLAVIFLLIIMKRFGICAMLKCFCGGSEGKKKKRKGKP